MNAPPSSESPPRLNGSVPSLRIRAVNDAPVHPDRAHVLYWMIATRRLEWNYGLERAVAWARELDRPLLVFEPLRSGYRWASHRLHRFCIDGMAEHARRLDGSRTGYFPYVEPEEGAGSGLLAALAEQAAVVVTDEFPSFFLPRMVAAAGRSLPVRLEAVDSNGILPLRQPDREFKTAYSFRRHLHKALPRWLEDGPSRHPLQGDPLPPFPGLSPEITDRWPPASGALLEGDSAALAALPIDDAVPPVPFAGGREAAKARLDRFLADRLPDYVDGRNHPDREVSSGLSPYLHWGHISAHEILDALFDHEDWNPGRLSDRSDGRRKGWWGMSPEAEAFVDQLVTWRELGYGTSFRLDDPEAYDTLPEWARETLAEHAGDPRPHRYDREQFETAATHDALWNAAQRQLLTEGTIHNYLRMLWGKKILEWSATPRDALGLMLELNNRWAIDGRNPNSTSGIFWILGRYDRGWPERAVFGTVRSMTSKSTRRKVDVDRYLERHGPQTALSL